MWGGGASLLGDVLPRCAEPGPELRPVARRARQGPRGSVQQCILQEGTGSVPFVSLTDFPKIYLIGSVRFGSVRFGSEKHVHWGAEGHARAHEGMRGHPGMRRGTEVGITESRIGWQSLAAVYIHTRIILWHRGLQRVRTGFSGAHQRAAQTNAQRCTLRLESLTICNTLNQGSRCICLFVVQKRLLMHASMYLCGSPSPSVRVSGWDVGVRRDRGSLVYPCH